MRVDQSSISPSIIERKIYFINMNNETIKTFRSSFLAGICIGIAGFGYLAEKSIIGAVLFAFGLLTVVHYGLRLYTGTAGFIKKGEVGKLLFIVFSSWMPGKCLAALPSIG